MRKSPDITGVASILAAIAFAVVLVVFAREIVDYRGNVEKWARRDLAMRARMAAANLAEPLDTQDFRGIGAIAAQLASDGVLLTVYTEQGGVFYRSPSQEPTDLRETAKTGEYRVELGFRSEDVFRPFNRALRGFLLAALVGVSGMFVVFFALYRQRVRIRELARLEKFRREFVADVSHEIKTPLTGILGAVSLLEDGAACGKGVPDPAHEGKDAVLISLIAKESKRLNGLVQQILDLARLEREDKMLDTQPTDLAVLVGDTVEEMRSRATLANVELKTSLEAFGPVVCDARLVAQAVSNLIENAIRYSGSPEVVVSLSGNAREVEIAVEDHGVGVPPDQAERIFERFHRLDPSRAAETGGAGLGLAIVRRIARLHGGDALCLPVTPHGARFVLRLRS